MSLSQLDLSEEIYGFLNGPFWGQKHGFKAQKWSDIGRNIMHSNNLFRSDPTYSYLRMTMLRG
jgi:hypothetical protein